MAPKRSSKTVGGGVKVPVIKPAFTSIINKCTVTVEPMYLGKHLKRRIDQHQKQLEGKCGELGWVKPDSMVITDYDVGGVVSMVSLSGYTKHVITYHAEVFIPTIGDIYECTVGQVHVEALKVDFGFFDKGKYITLLEIIVPRGMATMANEIDVVGFRKGDKVNVLLRHAVLGKNKVVVQAIGTTTKSPANYTAASFMVAGEEVVLINEDTEPTDESILASKVVDFNDFLEKVEGDDDEEVDAENGDEDDEGDDDEGDESEEGEESDEEEDEVDEDGVDDAADDISIVDDDDVVIDSDAEPAVDNDDE